MHLGGEERFSEHGGQLRGFKLLLHPFPELRLAITISATRQDKYTGMRGK